MVCTDITACPCCGMVTVYTEDNMRTREFYRHCMACGYHSAFDYMRNEDGIVRKPVLLPADMVVLTVRRHSDRGGSGKIVWESKLPLEVDTDFIYHYVNVQDAELMKKYPLFLLPDMAALRAQYGFRLERCVEKRLPAPSGKDGLPYARLDNCGTRIEVQTEGAQTMLLVDRAKYKYRCRQGYGKIIVEYTDGRPAYCQIFSQGTSVRRAEQLWAAHINEHTDYGRSYVTLMVGNTLRILRGTLSSIMS